MFYDLLKILRTTSFAVADERFPRNGGRLWGALAHPHEIKKVHWRDAHPCWCSPSGKSSICHSLAFLAKLSFMASNEIWLLMSLKMSLTNVKNDWNLASFPKVMSSNIILFVVNDIMEQLWPIIVEGYYLSMHSQLNYACTIRWISLIHLIKQDSKFI